MQDRDAHAKPIGELVDGLKTHLEFGLSSAEAVARLAQQGRNQLQERPRPGFMALLWRQFSSFLVILLACAALVSLLLGELVDSVAIMIIVALNAVVGVIQESKAEQALAALKRMAAPSAQVIRDGRQVTVPGAEIVSGDIVLLEAGNYVPADLRLVETVNLRIQEASLTGESVPVEKHAGVVLDKEIPLGDRRNSGFMGTLVTYGRGKGIVTGTGMNTQLGLIAEMLQTFEAEDTPLQKKLAHLGKVLGSACLVICALVFVLGLVRDTQLLQAFDMGILNYLRQDRKEIVGLFMMAVSLAIAAVPEGLPAIVTICLAIGMQRMIRHHALVRKLPAVETLGCATVVCSDKTGTLTQNQMTAVQAWAGGRSYRITGEGYSPVGQVLLDNSPPPPEGDPQLSALLQGALVCNDARLESRPDDSGVQSWQIIGDPTEGALVVAAAKAGFTRDDLVAALPRLQEIPFDSERKCMSTIHRVSAVASTAWTSALGTPPLIAFIKGAPDVVLDLCSHSLVAGKATDLTPELRAEVMAQNHALAGRALRVLAIACRPLAAMPDDITPANVESDLVLLGLIGMIDPPRPEVISALRVAHQAGLKTIMVTGDHQDTAEAVGRAIGLLAAGGTVLTGPKIERISDAELTTCVEQVDIFCRVSPQHKTRIVDALKARGHVVAMTGDGVNDAPALKRADIGIAMGITGSDVAKQTADMVLTDDNFASIIAAIEQGRIIYANIRKFVYFLLACNVGEILIIFFAMLLGMPVPLRPVQLLWLNLVSDGAPALALGLEQGDPEIMKQPPRAQSEPVIDRDMAIGIGIIGVIDAIAVLSVFYLAMRRYPDQLAAAQTIAFVTLCTSELIRAFTARSETRSVFSTGALSNRWMVWAVLTSFVLVMLVVYVPWLQPFFDTVPLDTGDWLLMLPFCFASPAAMELLKLNHRRRAAFSSSGAAPRG